MGNNKLLIVEDNVLEAIWAQHDAVKSGVKDYVIATNLSDALSYLPRVEMVATDLFFPAGRAQTDGYSRRFLPLYESFKESRFQKISHDNPFYMAIAQCAEVFGVTPQVYVEEFMPKMGTGKNVQDAARNALVGREDSKKYIEFQQIEEDIRTGRKLPLGIIVSEVAFEMGTPSVIVTSTNHHSNEFEPVRSLINVKYFDTLVDGIDHGRKDWKSGIDYLLGEKQ